MWTEALTVAEVLTTSEWRKAENMYYPPNIREIQAALLPLTVLEPIPPEQPSITQTFLPPLKVSIGLGPTGDKG